MMSRLPTLVSLLAFPLAVWAAPYVPTHDDEVVETLPEQRAPELSRLNRLREASRAAPRDLALADAFARGAITASRALGDPRYLGQARAALAPWWTSVDAPPGALLLRATIKQGLHDFDGALGDLDRLLVAAPDGGQARLTRAMVRNVIGRYADAMADCNALPAEVGALIKAACRAEIASRTGRAEEAYRQLADALATQGAEARVRAWASTLAAEIAARLGRDAAAERHFRQSLLLDPSDAYTLGAFADWNLDAGRPREAAALVASRVRNDALLLRLVIALKALPDREAYEDRRRELASRVEASRRRGDSVHRREEARYALEIEGDAAGAVRLARENWAVQREPADLRILAQSARAAGDRGALALALEWLALTRLEDVRVRSLVDPGA